MLISNGTTRRKLGLSNSSTSDHNVVGKVSSRRLINSAQPSPTSSSKSSSHKNTPTKNSTAKNLNEQLKLKKSLTSSAKSTKKTATTTTTTTTTTPSNKLNTSVKSLKNTSNKSSAKKQKLKERRHQRDDDDENDENEPDEYRYRDEEDLMNVDETDTGIGANEFEMPLIHMSHEEFERVDKCIESRLDELKRKLDALKSIDLTSSPTRHHHHIDPYLSEFCAELERLENDARANLTSIRFWFDKESFEIEEHYKNECKRSIHEYQERRKELKETLRNENEDARKQIEIERQTLDINSDVIEVKPAPTRNLRRRCGGGPGGSAGNNNTASGSNSLFSSQVYFDTLEASESMSMNSVGSGVGGVGAGGPPQTGASASFINTNHQSPLLTSNLSNVVETSSSVNGLYFASLIQQPSNGSSSLLNGSIIDRKQRKVGPLAITISEDEINEDHRCLLRSLKQPHSASPKPCMYS